MFSDDFDDLVLPLALGEDDVMEEGTGPAALLHLALPVMMAKAHPDLLDQLKGPIERGTYPSLGRSTCLTYWAS